MKMYGYWRSGTTYRVRLALALKKISIDMMPVNLATGEHLQPEFLAVNPSGAVPTLVLDDGTLISQSPAIIEYLEERFPDPSLLPMGAKARARVRHLAGIVAMDIHPLQNLRIQKYLKTELELPQDDVMRWLNRWMSDGFQALESLLTDDPDRGDFCFGNKAGLVECYLLPQLYAARRFEVDLAPFPTLTAIEAATLALPGVQTATPEAQMDAAG
ncbi:MAG: maleylacetoacetate isomerase [Pseudomonadota bacterium]